jgi:3'-phosphoadenosine 5'-phosphosulfate sulfotransferase (PAPS reductase)/FAD synthetase
MQHDRQAAESGQCALVPLGRSAPDLDDYDVILVNISGGKDSQAALDETVRAADRADVRDRIVTVFCDLGEDDEWPGTRELAAEHAARYQLRHEVVRREIVNASGERVPQSLTEHIEQRGMWPDAARRYCTSDLKRAPVHRLMTRLAEEQRARGITRRRVRILNVLGLRAQESPLRAAMDPFSPDRRASNKTVRMVDEWLPIHSWTTGQVWQRIAEAGTRPHPIYQAGMPRHIDRTKRGVRGVSDGRSLRSAGRNRAVRGGEAAWGLRGIRFVMSCCLTCRRGGGLCGLMASSAGWLPMMRAGRSLRFSVT